MLGQLQSAIVGDLLGMCDRGFMCVCDCVYLCVCVWMYVRVRVCLYLCVCVWVPVTKSVHENTFKNKNLDFIPAHAFNILVLLK